MAHKKAGHWTSINLASSTFVSLKLSLFRSYHLLFSGELRQNPSFIWPDPPRDPWTLHDAGNGRAAWKSDGDNGSQRWSEQTGTWM